MAAAQSLERPGKHKKSSTRLIALILVVRLSYPRPQGRIGPIHMKAGREQSMQVLHMMAVENKAHRIFHTDITCTSDPYIYQRLIKPGLQYQRDCDPWHNQY